MHFVHFHAHDLFLYKNLEKSVRIFSHPVLKTGHKLDEGVVQMVHILELRPFYFFRSVDNSIISSYEYRSMSGLGNRHFKKV